jgi:hypothetical protein
MRDRRRRSSQAGNARPEAEPDATGGGGLLGWLRKHIVANIIGAALVASLIALARGFFDPVLTAIAPSAADTVCTMREAVTNHWPFADPPPAVDQFRVLIATIDGDDSDYKYTRHIDSTFFNLHRIDRVRTSRVLRVAGRGEQVRAAATARDWLHQRHADLLIAGQVLKDRLHLWFIGNKAGQEFQAAYFDPKDLKEDFASTQVLGIALAAVEPARKGGANT